MASKHLTQKAVDALKTNRAREEVIDSAFRVRGVSLGVRLTREGAKAYFCRYRDVSGKRRRTVLGDARKISLRDAHEQAGSLSLITPVPPCETVPEPTLPASEIALTFGVLCGDYLKQHAIYKKDHGKKDERIIRLDLVPFLGDMEPQKIRRRDVIAVLDHIALERQAPIMANRTRALMSKIFNFAVEREIINVSPCVGLPRKRKEKPKDRFLDDDEIRALWEALDKEPPYIAVLFKMILLTGQRPGEVARARWCEFNNDVWTIPKERVKNGRMQSVPISPYLAQLLDSLPRRDDTGVVNKDAHHAQTGFVFHSGRKGCLSSRTIHLALQRVKTASGLKHFTAHDLRRTCATGLRRVGIARETVARILNHTPRSVTLVYDWYDEMPEMRRALNTWGDWVRNLKTNKEN